jgi:hypothetical protein
MSRNLSLLRLSRSALLFGALFLVLFVQVGSAQTDALSYDKNYFVTGDVIVNGVGGLRGTGVGGVTNATVNIAGVPQGADIVAAYAIWETVETTPTPGGAIATLYNYDQNGVIESNKPHGLIADLRGSSTPCWSSGGTGGANNGAARVYVADILRYLDHDPVTDDFRVANGNHTFTLADSGKQGNGNIVYVDGISMVVVYRVLGTPGATPLRSVVIYDGAFTMTKLSASMTQKIGGFYDALGTANGVRMTQIVANGQAGNTSNLTVNGGAVTGGTNPFTGTAGTRWDDATFNFTLPQQADSYSTAVTSSDNQICLTWTAIVTSTQVEDSDNDGLLDSWESKGLHFNPGDATHPATFGDCSYAGETCVNLPAMGADPKKQDIFLEFDWMQSAAWSGNGDSGAAHTHIPNVAALKMVGDAFHSNSINLHFDLGNNYQDGLTLPLCASGLDKACIIPYNAAIAKAGGEIIDESTLLCPRAGYAGPCAYSEPYSVLSWKVGYEEVKNGSATLGTPSHFSRDRKDIFHYVLFGHALAAPELDLNTGLPTGHPKSVSGVADFPGGDILITLGRWRSDSIDPNTGVSNDQVGSQLIQAGTLIHELGHNLNLAHAGAVKSPNCIPNYLSNMNYLYQTRGLTDALNAEHVDYSHGLLTTVLDETALSETALLGPVGVVPTYKIRYFGPLGNNPADSAAQLHCDGTPLKPGVDLPMMRLENSFLNFIDWNNDGVQTNGTFPLDVNYDGTIGPPALLLADYNDWGNLNLQQVGIRAGVGELSLDAQVTDLSASDPGSADFGSADFGSADFGSADFGSADFGSADFGSADFGDEDYRTRTLATLDPPPPPSPSCPTCGLKATNKIDRITLNFTSPDTHVDLYNIYRKSDQLGDPGFQFLKSVAGGVSTITTDDTTVSYNVTYTYVVRSQATINGKTVESGKSTEASGIVKHLFVRVDLTMPFLTPFPSPWHPSTGAVTGKDISQLDLTTVNCTSSVPYNSKPGTYVGAITCTGPAAVAPNGTADLIDGITYTPGTLTITKPNPK